MIVKLKIAIASGKGGTGKTFVSTNLARVLELMGETVRYLDCDVEEPNGHLFLKPDISQAEQVTILAPAGVDETRCTACGKCAAACRYHALARVGKSILVFEKLCHVCGACSLVCPEHAIVLKERKIGELKIGVSGTIGFYYGLLETGEGGMTPRLIRRVKERTGEGINIFDSPPGTSCPVVETVKDADLCALVTDPTPFGVNDLKLAVDMCRELDHEPVIIVNRAEYLNNDLKEYCSREGLEIIGEIPDERKIAECYSVGDLAVERFPEYAERFRELGLKLLERASRNRPAGRAVKPLLPRREPLEGNDRKNDCLVAAEKPVAWSGKEVVVISGKGGTGKTSLAACFAFLGKNIAIADCDVDAADLHLVLRPEIVEQGWFSGGNRARIDPGKCLECGVCLRACRFGAVHTEFLNGRNTYVIDERACEGCGVCGIVCRFGAVEFYPAVNGEWYVSETRCGPMSHAKLGIAQENSGKLVSLIRSTKNRLASARRLERSLSDGSPGTGCPVIASITGTDYAVVVTEPTVSGVHDLARILDVIKFFNLRSGVIVNKSDVNPGKTKEITELISRYASDLLGTIPYDKAFTEAQHTGLSIVEYADSPATAAIRGIWVKIGRMIND